MAGAGWPGYALSLRWAWVLILSGEDGDDKGTVFAADEILNTVTLDGIEIPLWEVFEAPGPAAPARRLPLTPEA